MLTMLIFSFFVFLFEVSYAFFVTTICAVFCVVSVVVLGQRLRTSAILCSTYDREQHYEIGSTTSGAFECWPR